MKEESLKAFDQQVHDLTQDLVASNQQLTECTGKLDQTQEILQENRVGWNKVAIILNSELYKIRVGSNREF